jgi:hypothetical protein
MPAPTVIVAERQKWPGHAWFGDIPAELAGSGQLTRKQQLETRSAPDGRRMSINFEAPGGSMTVPDYVEGR